MQRSGVEMDLKRIGDLLLSEKNRFTSGNAGHLYHIILRSTHKTSFFRLEMASRHFLK